MINYIEGSARDQDFLLPESLDDYVAEDNPIRFIECFVDQLDLAECGFEAADPKERFSSLQKASSSSLEMLV